MALKLSVVILTKNEEKNIRECLDSVKWADEVIVLDDLSSDRTVEICREYTDKIFVRELKDFGEQRQFGIDQASCEWVLFLDADERITAGLEAEIKESIGPPSPYDGFYIRKKTFLLGKEIRHCGWDASILKLFMKEKARCDLRKVHETILVSGPVGQLKNPCLHYSYTSISQYVLKMDKYSTWGAQELFHKGLRITPFNITLYWVIKPAVAFFRKFILMRGFLDGREGLLISVFTAFVVFLHHVKVWELQKKGHEHNQ